MASKYEDLDGELKKEHSNVVVGPFGTYPAQNYSVSLHLTTVPGHLDDDAT